MTAANAETSPSAAVVIPTSLEVTASVLSIAPGYDPRYLTRQVGTGMENYYLSAVAEHGEPPGVWWGPGAAELGLDGEVDAKVMEKLYDTFLDPRDPHFLDESVPDEEKARLGRKKQRFKSAEEILAQKLAAEPEASAERREELRIEANRESRQAVIHHDATFSPTKSVTLLHAGLQAAAVKAEAAGRKEEAAGYRQAADVVWDAVDAGAAAALRYLQEHAGDARYGYHGVDIEGRTTGKWIDAGNWVVARFRQHTNREGEPQLHVHQAILNRQLCADGKWRGLDGKALYRVRAAAGAVSERVMEEYLTRGLGVAWQVRPDGNGRELVGVSRETIEAFSTRRVQVTKELAKRIETYEAAHGRTPSARAIFKMAQDATKATKAPKRGMVPTRQEQLRDWERRTTEREIQQLSSIPQRVIGRLTGRVAEQASQQLADLDIHRVITAAIADAQREKTTFSRYELMRFINRHLPDYLGGLPAERVEAVLEDLTDAALDPTGPAAGRLLNAPDVVHVPEVLRRADGRSVYQAPTAERYTTVAQLDAEMTLIASATATGAPAVEPDAARALLEAGGGPAEQAPLERDGAALDGEQPGPATTDTPVDQRPPAAEAPEASREPEAASPDVEAAPRGAEQPAAEPAAANREPMLREDQAAAVHGILTSGRRVDVLVGPAGTGKSFTVSRLSELWRRHTGTPVVGLTTSQNAAWVLAGEGLDDAHNITRWLQEVDAGRARVVPGQMIVVDEASMVTNDHLSRIQAIADRFGCKVVWSGDHGQLVAPGAGGAMRHLVEQAGAYQLTEVARFAEEWEREASLQLRTGQAEALADYEHQGRLLGGDQAEMESAAQRAYLADFLAGRRSLLLAPTNEKAAELAAKVRHELVDLGIVTADGRKLRDGNTAGLGDLVMARQNDQKIPVLDMTSRAVNRRELTNRDVLRVVHLNEDGSLVARLLDSKGCAGARVEIPATYVSEHVELAYAGTVHAAQGRTVDTCHSLVDESATRQMLYVMLTRGRLGNFAYTVVDRIRQADLRSGPEQSAEHTGRLLRDAASLDREPGSLDDRAHSPQRSHLSVLTEILRRDEASQTAVEAMLGEAQRPRHMGHLGSMWIDVIRDYTADAYIASAEARGTLSASEAARLHADDAKGTLGRLLRQIEMSGRDAHAILDAAIAERELGSADSAAQVLHWRITTAGAERGLDVKTLDVDERQITGTWRDRTPRLGRDDIDGFLDEVAAAMQRREAELGEQALHRPPVWLTEAIGQPPEQNTRDWAARAGRILAYREQYGHASDIDTIGPAPSRSNPEQRASWWSAYDALGRVGADVDFVDATLGELWTMRAAYERETRWAPPYVADELGKVAIEARQRAAEAVRLRARAERLPEGPERQALHERAAGQEALAEALTSRRERLQQIHGARQAWHQATEDARLRAMRADAELRRRDGVDAAELPPLHREFVEAQELIERQRAIEDQLGVHPGQLTLDVGDLPRTPPPAAEPTPLSKGRLSREDHLYLQFTKGQEHGTPPSMATIARELDISIGEAAKLALRWREQHQQDQTVPARPVEQQTEPHSTAHPDQLTLDVFGDQQGTERTTGDIDAVIEHARAARKVADDRAAGRAAEIEETERRRREAEQREPLPHDEVERHQERIRNERERLEQRQADRGRPGLDEEAREAVRLAELERGELREALRRTQQREHDEHERQHARSHGQQPDRGPDLSR